MHTKLENIHLAAASQKANVALKFVDAKDVTILMEEATGEPHSWQLLNTSDKNGADTRQGVWSEFENIFSNIVRHLN